MVFKLEDPVPTNESTINQIHSWLRTHYNDAHLSKLSDNSHCFFTDSESNVPVLFITDRYVCIPDGESDNNSMLDMVQSLSKESSMNSIQSDILSYIRSIYQNSKLL